MRKFTLFLVSLFLTVGAMAQVPDPVLELTAEQIGTTYPYELSTDDANKVFDLDGALTVAVRINTAAITNTNRYSLFATSDPTMEANTSAEGMDSRHVGYGIYGKSPSYLASWRGGDRFSGKDNRLASNTNSYILVYVVSPGIKVELYTNGIKDQNTWSGTGFMDGYEFATPAMVKADHPNAKIYIGGGKHSGGTGEVFNGTITGVKVFRDALSAEQIAEITFPAEEGAEAEAVVRNVEELDNSKVYNLITTRGWLIYNSENASVVASTASYATFTTGADVEACQWAIYKSENNKYYLYNIAAGKFVGRNAEEGGRFPFVKDVTNDIKVVENTTETDYALVFSTDNYGAINHFNHAAEPGVANWKGNASTGGLRALNDAGSAHKVVEVADIAPETLEAIKSAVAVYEADNTDAVAALDVVIEKAQALFEQITIGTGVGKYTTTDTDYMNKFNTIVAFREDIQVTNTPTPAEVEAKTAELNALIASFQLNMPVAGKYYTFKNDAYYITSGVTGDGKIALSETKDATAIYYFDGTHLLAYTTGLYFGLNANDWTFEAVGSTDISTITFVAAVNGAVGKYNINSGGRWLHRTDAYVNRCSANTCGNAHNWTIEEVTSLPVTISAAGYATFYAPVAVTVPAGVKAHTVTVNGEWAILNEIASGVIPANTGVILEGEGSFDFAVTTAGAFEGENLMSGTVAKTLVTKPENTECYVLAKPEGAEVAAMYIAVNGEGETKDVTKFYNAGHKAYLAVEGASGVSFYGFRFDEEENTTAIEKVETENEQEVIFDLAGRRVSEITEKGIYIVNGKKVLVK
ncbi:MAG: hypothetical protein J6U58_06805 [Bacteroidaceae bacterium]|nr:hypothetical protein [Bacteroidaceae bacterium]